MYTDQSNADTSQGMPAAGRSKEWILPQIFWRECSPADPDFSPVILILDFWPPELWETISLVLNHQVGGNLLQQQQETNTTSFIYFPLTPTSIYLCRASPSVHHWHLQGILHSRCQSNLQPCKWAQFSALWDIQAISETFKI